LHEVFKSQKIDNSVLEELMTKYDSINDDLKKDNFYISQIYYQIKEISDKFIDDLI